VNRNVWIRCLIALLVLAILTIGVWWWRVRVITRQADLAACAVSHGVAVGDFVSARSALAGFRDPALRTAKEREVRSAEFQQALSISDTGLLRRAIGSDGEQWIAPAQLEAADLILAREAVLTRDFEYYQKIHSKWRERSAQHGQWVLLEADELLALKQPDDALRLLQEARLSGQEEAQRNARLALLEAREPWKAISTVDEGLKADPKNADLLSFRAQIEEAAGRDSDARLDYVAAVLSERRNPLHREILANFYLRHGNLQGAAETWRDAAEDTGLGVYALKSWFWARMAGVHLAQALPPSRQPGWRELISALSATPDDMFWSSDLDLVLSRVSAGVHRPEIVWLRVLESIRSQPIKSARAQIEIGFPRAAENLKPDLALKLLAGLAAREGQDPHMVFAGRDMLPQPRNAHPFDQAFNNWVKRVGTDDERGHFEAWLAQPAATVATLLAVGWSGAALTVGQAEKLVPGPDAPDWFDAAYASALLIRDGKAPAQTWLESLPSRSKAAELQLGEILLTSGKVDKGLATLRQLAVPGSPVSSRASWTLALAELDGGNAAAARQVTVANPSFSDSVQGKEILARIALAEGSRAETIRIYKELGDQSADAMIFLSKEAFAAGDFAQARKWTSILAQQFPEQPRFRLNLLQIDQAEKRSKP